MDIKKLVSELHELLDQLSDLEKIKEEYAKEISQRSHIEEESHKIQTSLEERLAEHEAEIKRISAARQHEAEERIRIEEESHKIQISLEARLAEREAEINRISAERIRIEEESHKIQASLEERLAVREAEINRISKELQHDVEKHQMPFVPLPEHRIKCPNCSAVMADTDAKCVWCGHKNPKIRLPYSDVVR